MSTPKARRGRVSDVFSFPPVNSSLQTNRPTEHLENDKKRLQAEILELQDTLSTKNEEIHITKTTMADLQLALEHEKSLNVSLESRIHQLTSELGQAREALTKQPEAHKLKLQKLRNRAEDAERTATHEEARNVELGEKIETLKATLATVAEAKESSIDLIKKTLSARNDIILSGIADMPFNNLRESLNKHVKPVEIAAIIKEQCDTAVEGRETRLTAWISVLVDTAKSRPTSAGTVIFDVMILSHLSLLPDLHFDICQTMNSHSEGLVELCITEIVRNIRRYGEEMKEMPNGFEYHSLLTDPLTRCWDVAGHFDMGNKVRDRLIRGIYNGAMAVMVEDHGAELVSMWFEDAIEDWVTAHDFALGS